VKWNTQRKAVVAVLALAGAAFCVDRFVLGYSPQAAAAVETTADIIASAPAKTGVTPAARGIARTASLSARLAALAERAPGPELASAGDAFCIPAAWGALIREAEVAQIATTSAAAPTGEAARFLVSSVFLGSNPSNGAARINGRLIRVGQSIGGHQLVRIENGRPAVVVLSGADGEVRVPLDIGGDNVNPGPDEAVAPEGKS
jgi:hypothetical protein